MSTTGKTGSSAPKSSPPPKKAAAPAKPAASTSKPASSTSPASSPSTTSSSKSTPVASTSSTSSSGTDKKTGSDTATASESTSTATEDKFEQSGEFKAEEEKRNRPESATQKLIKNLHESYETKPEVVEDKVSEVEDELQVGKLTASESVEALKKLDSKVEDVSGKGKDGLQKRVDALKQELKPAGNKETPRDDPGGKIELKKEGAKSDQRAQRASGMNGAAAQAEEPKGADRPAPAEGATEAASSGGATEPAKGEPVDPVSKRSEPLDPRQRLEKAREEARLRLEEYRGDKKTMASLEAAYGGALAERKETVAALREELSKVYPAEQARELAEQAVKSRDDFYTLYSSLHHTGDEAAQKRLEELNPAAAEVVRLEPRSQAVADPARSAYEQELGSTVTTRSETSQPKVGLAKAADETTHPRTSQETPSPTRLSPPPRPGLDQKSLERLKASGVIGGEAEPAAPPAERSETTGAPTPRAEKLPSLASSFRSDQRETGGIEQFSRRLAESFGAATAASEGDRNTRELEGRSAAVEAEAKTSREPGRTVEPEAAEAGPTKAAKAETEPAAKGKLEAEGAGVADKVEAEPKPEPEGGSILGTAAGVAASLGRSALSDFLSPVGSWAGKAASTVVDAVSGLKPQSVASPPVKPVAETAAKPVAQNGAGAKMAAAPTEDRQVGQPETAPSGKEVAAGGPVEAAKAAGKAEKKAGDKPDQLKPSGGEKPSEASRSKTAVEASEAKAGQEALPADEAQPGEELTDGQRRVKAAEDEARQRLEEYRKSGDTEALQSVDRAFAAAQNDRERTVEALESQLSETYPPERARELAQQAMENKDEFYARYSGLHQTGDQKAKEKLEQLNPPAGELAAKEQQAALPDVTTLSKEEQVGQVREAIQASAQERAKADPAAFRKQIEEFYPDSPPEKINELVAQAERGELPVPEQVSFVSPEDEKLLTATSRYDAESGTLFLSEDLQHNPAALRQAMLDGTAQHLDKRMGVEKGLSDILDLQGQSQQHGQKLVTTMESEVKRQSNSEAVARKQGFEAARASEETTAKTQRVLTEELRAALEESPRNRDLSAEEKDQRADRIARHALGDAESFDDVYNRLYQDGDASTRERLTELNPTMAALAESRLSKPDGEQTITVDETAAANAYDRYRDAGSDGPHLDPLSEISRGYHRAQRRNGRRTINALQEVYEERGLKPQEALAKAQEAVASEKGLYSQFSALYNTADEAGKKELQRINPELANLLERERSGQLKTDDEWRQDVRDRYDRIPMVGDRLAENAIARVESKLISTAQTDEQRNLADTFQSAIKDRATADPREFAKDLKTAFPNANRETIERLVDLAQDGKFPLAEKVNFVDSKDALLNGENASYHEQSETIYLDKALLSDPQKVLSAYVEENGHHLDKLLGGGDSRGDEGELLEKSVLRGGIKFLDKYKAKLDEDHDFVFAPDGTVRVIENQVRPNPGAVPTTGPVTNPISGPITNPTTGPVTNPISGPITNPTTGPVTHPISGPTTNPNSGPVTNPISGPTTNPNSGPATNPTKSPVTPDPVAKTPVTNPSNSATTPTLSPAPTPPSSSPANGHSSAPAPAPAPSPTPEPIFTPAPARPQTVIEPPREMPRPNVNPADQTLEKQQQDVRAAELKNAEELSHLNETLAKLKDLPQALSQLEKLQAALKDMGGLSKSLEDLKALNRTLGDLKGLTADLESLKRLGTLQSQVKDLPQKLADLERLPSALGTLTDLSKSLGNLERLPTMLQQMKELPARMANLERLPSLLTSFNRLPDTLADVGKLPVLLESARGLSTNRDGLTGLRAATAANAAAAGKGSPPASRPSPGPSLGTLPAPGLGVGPVPTPGARTAPRSTPSPISQGSVSATPVSGRPAGAEAGKVKLPLPPAKPSAPYAGRFGDAPPVLGPAIGPDASRQTTRPVRKPNPSASPFKPIPGGTAAPGAGSAPPSPPAVPASVLKDLPRRLQASSRQPGTLEGVARLQQMVANPEAGLKQLPELLKNLEQLPESLSTLNRLNSVLNDKNQLTRGLDTLQDLTQMVSKQPQQFERLERLSGLLGSVNAQPDAIRGMKRLPGLMNYVDGVKGAGVEQVDRLLQTVRAKPETLEGLKRFGEMVKTVNGNPGAAQGLDQLSRMVRSGGLDTISQAGKNVATGLQNPQAVFGLDQLESMVLKTRTSPQAKAGIERLAQLTGSSPPGRQGVEGLGRLGSLLSTAARNPASVQGMVDKILVAQTPSGPAPAAPNGVPRAMPDRRQSVPDRRPAGPGQRGVAPAVTSAPTSRSTPSPAAPGGPTPTAVPTTFRSAASPAAPLGPRPAAAPTLKSAAAPAAPGGPKPAAAPTFGRAASPGPAAGAVGSPNAASSVPRRSRDFRNVFNLLQEIGTKKPGAEKHPATLAEMSGKKDGAHAVADALEAQVVAKPERMLETVEQLVKTPESSKSFGKTLANVAETTPDRLVGILLLTSDVEGGTQTVGNMFARLAETPDTQASLAQMIAAGTRTETGAAGMKELFGKLLAPGENGEADLAVQTARTLARTSSSKAGARGLSEGLLNLTTVDGGARDVGAMLRGMSRTSEGARASADLLMNLAADRQGAKELGKVVARASRSTAGGRDLLTAFGKIAQTEAGRTDLSKLMVRLTDSSDGARLLSNLARDKGNAQKLATLFNSFEQSPQAAQRLRVALEKAFHNPQARAEMEVFRGRMNMDPGLREAVERLTHAPTQSQPLQLSQAARGADAMARLTAFENLARAVTEQPREAPVRTVEAAGAGSAATDGSQGSAGGGTDQQDRRPFPYQSHPYPDLAVVSDVWRNTTSGKGDAAEKLAEQAQGSSGAKNEAGKDEPATAFRPGDVYSELTLLRARICGDCGFRTNSVGRCARCEHSLLRYQPPQAAPPVQPS